MSATVLTTHKWLTIPDRELATYNATDVYHTARLVAPLTRELERRGQLKWFRERYWPMTGVVIDMQRRGVGYLDKPLRNAARKWVRAALDDVETAVWAWVGSNYARETFFNSPKQLARFLYDDLALPCPPKTTKRAARSTSQEALAWILSHARKRDAHAIPILHNLFHRSRLATDLERYLIIEGDPDGRVRPTIKLGSAETMRLAYGGPRGSGLALQQWPEEIRSIIRAAPGHVYINRDYSAIEARLLAILSQDRSMLETFARGDDIHIQNSLDFFAISMEGWLGLLPAQQKATRNYTKSQGYKLSYGGEPESESRKLTCPCWRCADKAPPTLDLSPAERKAAGERWFGKHKAVVTFRDDLLESVKGRGADHTYTSPWGCVRAFMEPAEAAKRSLYNYPLQHGASQVVNAAMCRLHYTHRAPLVLQHHDSLMLEVPIADANRWDDILGTEMERPVPELGGAILPTESTRGETWGGLH